MAHPIPERLLGDLVSLAHAHTDVPGFAQRVARILARAVPFDGICVVTMDPATRLPTGEVVENGLPDWAKRRIAEIEVSGDDLITFQSLACSTRHAASLSEATNGDLNLSIRHREIKRSNGFGDELRASLLTDSATWGGIALLRGRDRRNFTDTDSALIASLSPYLAEGLRRAMLFTAISEKRHDHDANAGIALVSPDNVITEADPSAARWLAELGEHKPSGPLSPAVTAIVSRARNIAAGRAPTTAIARARVRTLSGQWLLLRGSTLGPAPDAQTALILEPAKPHELAPFVAHAYGLSARERAVTQLVAQGMSTNAISARLYLSPWTVQDHLKSIFAKVGVGTRGELIAQIFFDQYSPSLTDGVVATLETPTSDTAGPQ